MNQTETNILIFEQVLGREYCKGCFNPNCPGLSVIHNYCGDSLSAFEIVEFLVDRGFDVTLTSVIDYNDNEKKSYLCDISFAFDRVIVYDETIALAICRAAVKLQEKGAFN